MCECVCVCVSVSVYVCVCVRACVCECVCVCECLCVRFSVCLYVRVSVSLCMCLSFCLRLLVCCLCTHMNQCLSLSVFFLDSSLMSRTHPDFTPDTKVMTAPVIEADVSTPMYTIKQDGCCISKGICSTPVTYP